VTTNDAVKLKELLSCPLDGALLPGYAGFENLVRCYWYGLVKLNKIDSEHLCFDSGYEVGDVELDLLADELGRMLENAVLWIDHARRKFDAGTRSIVSLRIAEYAKHERGVDEVARRHRSRGKISQLLPSLDHVEQLRIARTCLGVMLEKEWLCLEEAPDGIGLEDPTTWVQVWDDVMRDASTLILGVDARRRVGFVGGQDTNYLCVNFSLRTPEVHLYPISESEFTSSQKAVVLSR